MSETNGRHRLPDDPILSALSANMSSAVERRVEVAAIAIQKQFEGVARLIDQRIDSNREQSEIRVEAQDRLSITRWEAVKQSLKDLEITQASASERRTTEIFNLITARLDAINDARAIQAVEYERRLTILNHEHARLDVMGATYVRSDLYNKDMERLYTERREMINVDYVRNDLYAKDMERLYTERRDQMASSEQARRANVATAVMAAISILGLVVTITLHFVKGGF